MTDSLWELSRSPSDWRFGEATKAWTCDLQALWRKGNPDQDHTTTRALVYNSAWLAIVLNLSDTYVVNLIH